MGPKDAPAYADRSTHPSASLGRIIIEPDSRSPQGTDPMDPLTILLISLATLVAANLAASRQKA